MKTYRTPHYTTFSAEVLGDSVCVDVSKDPVTLRWQWRGVTRWERDEGLADTRELAEAAGRAWLVEQVRARAEAWTAVLAEVSR